MQLRPYQKLIAWQEAYRLCLWMYRITNHFPAREQFGLTKQIRRAASSVPINIAEGNIKRSTKEKMYFFETALASLNEVHCESLLAKDLSYISEAEFESTDQHIHRVSYLLTKLRSSFVP